jgi:POT family proton-dependent oligopeptide transporter
MDTGFFGHPRGLATLFFTEFWERFSYYGMRALLILFMTATVAEGGFGFTAERAGAIYGLYTAGVYLFALPGGWVADRLLGQRRAVFWGGVLIAMGHFSLALEDPRTFFAGLVFIVLGTGLLKPNISTMVGELYSAEDNRRDAGFSLFYMGINLGAFVSPLVCGYLGQRIDWHWGFAAAGVGMVCGLIQYRLGAKLLGSAGLEPDSAPGSPERRQALNVLIAVVVVAAGLIALVAAGVLRVSAERVADTAGLVIVGLAVAFLLYQLLLGGLNGTEKKKTFVIFVLFIFSAIFWSGFEQAGSSFNLFAERLTDTHLFRWEMPASWLQSVNGGMIVVFAPIFAWLWLALAKRNLEPSSPAKFSLGLIFLGLGFGVLVWAAILTHNQTRQVGLGWLMTTYLLHTFGELCLSPVGLSTVTKLAPHRKVGQMMGIWFMSLALGNLLAGLVAGQFETLPLPQLFGAVMGTTAGAGILLALFIRPIRKLMGGVH